MRARDLFFGGFKMMKTYSKTAWMIIIPMAILSFAMNYMMQNWQFSNIENALNNQTPPDPFNGIGMMLLMMLISMFFAAVIAVGWHRRALLDQPFSWSIGDIFRKPVWSYIVGVIIVMLVFFAIYIVGIIAMVIVGGVLGFITPMLATILIPVAIAFLIWLIVFLIRLSLILPARAVERPITLKEALAATQGQFWMIVRYLLITIAAGMVVMLILSPFIIPQFQAQMQIANGVITDPAAIMESLKPSMLYLILVSIFGAIMGLYQVGIMTILYAHFVGTDKEQA